MLQRLRTVVTHADMEEPEGLADVGAAHTAGILRHLPQKARRPRHGRRCVRAGAARAQLAAKPRHAVRNRRVPAVLTRPPFTRALLMTSWRANWPSSRRIPLSVTNGMRRVPKSPPPYRTVPLPSSDLIPAGPAGAPRYLVLLLAGTTGRESVPTAGDRRGAANSRADDHGHGGSAFSRFNAPQNSSSVTSAMGSCSGTRRPLHRSVSGHIDAILVRILVAWPGSKDGPPCSIREKSIFAAMTPGAWEFGGRSR